MSEMHTDLPKTINEALKILAYNDYFWSAPQKAHIKPHPKDQATVRSLAEAQYVWTEKQARLALVILKRYLTKFQSHGMDIKSLLDHPKYEDEFRVISFDKSIEKFIDDDDEEKIEVRFPYHKKIISLIRILKNKRGLPSNYALYNGEAKKWTFIQSDVTTYYLTLIAVRYDFKFVDETLLDDYEMIKKEILGYRQPSARLVAGEIILDNASTSLQEYWEQNLKNKPPLLQVDSLKNFNIKTNGIKIPAETTLGYQIAHTNHHKLWLDSIVYSKNEVVKGLIELDCFPIIMPVSGELSSEEEVKEFWEWMNTFKANGIDILNDCSWGFDVKEPVYMKDIDNEMNRRQMMISNTISETFFENLFELHQMSKQFKFINDNTKIIFVRNRIPRALIKSKIKPKASLVALGGGYYAAGTDNLKRLLENLPKKLYYNIHQPSNIDWNDSVIVKL
jgi:hypothetical protein|tara:strand:+ start:272 stop:1618 length:1347 start_codon:yes stop_codon:yes gene_type:complete